jgi:hypothetical protein
VAFYSPSALERFWSYVKVAGVDECWEWVGYRTRNGYGKLRVVEKLVSAHRMAWEIANGPIPEGPGYHGTCVRHRCDNRACCNPAHLLLGTHKQNMADAKERRRRADGERHYRSKLTSADVVDIRQSVSSTADIADRLGVSPATVWQVRDGRTWKDVA